MNGIDLGQKMGPLPLGGWVAAVGLVGGFLYMNRGSGTPDLVPVAERGVGEGGGQFIYDEPQKVGGTDPDFEDTNQLWGQRALNWLIQQGTDPGKADQAVRKYLHSDPLSIQEQAIINLALLKFGTPPEALTPVDNLPETPGEPEEPAGRPHLQLQAEPNSISKKGTFRLVGRTSYGGSGNRVDSSGDGPGAPQLVQITVYDSRSPTRVVSRYFTMTDNSGNFSTVPGWTNPIGNERRYSASWKGAFKGVYVKMN